MYRLYSNSNKIFFLGSQERVRSYWKGRKLGTIDNTHYTGYGIKWGKRKKRRKSRVQGAYYWSRRLSRKTKAWVISVLFLLGLVGSACLTGLMAWPHLCTHENQSRQGKLFHYHGVCLSEEYTKTPVICNLVGSYSNPFIQFLPENDLAKNFFSRKSYFPR